ncbi:MAG: hypothetical protein EOM20_10625 [Spartobacteria bacterium]|nr:hypothetical protein [Spartobacteria bacterium]
MYKRWWFWAAAIILLFALIGSMGGGGSEQVSQPSTNSSNNQAGNDQAETVEEEPAPVALEVTVDKLIEDLKRNALSAANTYEDAYVELNGALVTIDSSGDYFSLGILADDFSFDTVLCRIEDKHLEQVMNFETGQTVVVTGTIVSVGEVMGYTLKVENIL